ncbi:MAG: hypothetical protein JWR58_3282 [Pseudonocardia sp.]|jgi:hypothetical protein|nr:hypothetical protein [Pseudonocardia sp.]
MMAEVPLPHHQLYWVSPNPLFRVSWSGPGIQGWPAARKRLLSSRRANKPASRVAGISWRPALKSMRTSASSGPAS